MVIALKFDWFFKNAVLFVIGLSNSPIIITNRPITNYRTTKLLQCTVMTSISWEYTGTSDYCEGSTIANSALNFCF